MKDTAIPVITIDGPSASGKGTVANLVAKKLMWHVLDSGALYRLTALSCLNKQTNLSQIQDVAQIAQELNIKFENNEIYLENELVTGLLKQEKVGETASKIAVYPELRAALLQKQYDFRQLPGLVADGRDMGTVIFPDANLKIFLEASVVERAKRRYKQLIEKGFSAKIESLIEELSARDKRDKERIEAPLVAAKDAFIIDSTALGINEVVEQVLCLWRNQQS